MGMLPLWGFEEGSERADILAEIIFPFWPAFVREDTYSKEEFLLKSSFEVPMSKQFLWYTTYHQLIMTSMECLYV